MYPVLSLDGGREAGEGVCCGRGWGYSLIGEERKCREGLEQLDDSFEERHSFSTLGAARRKALGFQRTI